ncbi:MAG: sulfotransferase [Acidobacteriota bacterium]|nr:sulfotransferase [Acidobacteriota bacterium]
MRPFPFVVGCGRSGTTLLTVMLDSHPELAIPGETAGFMLRFCLRHENFGSLADPHSRPDGLLSPEPPHRFDRGEVLAMLDELSESHRFRRWGVDPELVVTEVLVTEASTRPEVMRAVYHVYARLQGKELCGDKTPDHVLHMPRIAELFPEARFIHLIRDGRDVALAMRDTSWAPKTADEAARHWVQRVGRGREDATNLGSERYLEVRYEDLVLNPGPVLERACAFLGIDFHPAMLDYTSAADRQLQMSPAPEEDASLRRTVTPGLRDWRTQMAPEDVAEFERVAGTLLFELDYPVTTRI